MSKMVNVWDWYDNPETTNPRLRLRVDDDGYLTPSQIKRVRAACPNWTRQIEELQRADNGFGVRRARVRVEG